MSASEFSLIAMPEWYRTERETEKTIEKLNSVKELDYYLRNPDEYIRRLAILRLYKLTDKDTLYFLKELLDDPAESDENKYLAAWVLKSLSKKWVSDIFVNNSYLGKFSGHERFEELFSIKQEQSSPSVEFDFTSSISYSALKLDSDESALEKDIFFETEFDFKQWFSTFGSRLLKTSVSALCAILGFFMKLPVLLGTGIYSLFKKLSHLHIRNSKIKVKPIGRAQRSKQVKQSDTSYDFYSLRKELYKKPGAAAFIKKGVFQLFYILFFPVRFALKHKLAILCLFIMFYMFLTFTDYGRAFTNKYMTIDLKEIQNSTVQKVKDYTAFALSEFNRLTGIDEWKQEEKTRQSKDTLMTADLSGPGAAKSMLYVVTAKKGLNIRKSPDSASDKIGENSLAYGSTVTYLTQTKKDNYGGTWYYVEAKDGRIGWVSAMYLKEKEVS